MMKMVVKTSSNETYEKEIIQVSFYQGKLIVTDKDGNTSSYTKESLETGMVTIM